MNLNTMIFKMINGLAHQNMILDKIMIFMSTLVPDIFMVVLAIVYIIGMFKKNSKMKGAAIDTLIITIINLFLSFIIGAIWYVPRPFVNSKVNLLIPHTVDASFPSDHAIGTMSIAVGVSKYNKMYGGLLVILSILVGISRVFVGHHYPTDVLGGYAIVLIITFIYDRLLRNKVHTIYFKVEGLLVKRFPLFNQFL